MKVTLIGTLPPIKAASPYCFHLADGLTKKINLEFISFQNLVPNIFYTGGLNEGKDNLKTINNFEIQNILKFYNPFSWIKVGLAAKGEIIHAQYWEIYQSLIYLVIFLCAKIKGKKIVLTLHNITHHNEDFFIGFFYKKITKIILILTDAVIVHNQRNKDKFCKIYSYDENKLFIITHGILKPYHPIKGISKKDARKYFGIANKKKSYYFLVIFGNIKD